MGGVRACGPRDPWRSEASAVRGRIRPAVPVVGLVLLVSACRLLTQRTGGSSLGDMGFWYSWSAALDRGDWRRFYALTGCDYLPGYLYVLWLLGQIQLGIANAPGLVRAVAPSQDLLYKLPAMAADAATVGLIYLMGRRDGGARAPAFLPPRVTR